MPPQTDPALELRVRTSSRQFYEELEKRCKRFQPNHFIPTIISIMRNCKLKHRYVYAPPFQVGLMIEANCTYSRLSNNDILTWPRYAKIKNIFHNTEEPALLHLINHDMGNFMLVLHRQQIELQKSIEKPDIARFYHLYAKEGAIPKLSFAMECVEGITPRNWLMAAMAIYSAAKTDPHGKVIAPTEGVDQVGTLNKSSVERFLAKASFTPEEIATRFKELRSTTQPAFHNCIRSVFIERPLIKLGQNAYATPFPNILLHFASDGLYGILASLPEFSHEFGEAMRCFTSRTARHIPDNRLQLEDTKLEQICDGKSCDIVIELTDSILLIESKTSAFQRNIITPATIARDNSTTKIKKAIDQLISTATNIRNGKLNSYGVSSNKPIYAIVTTFGDIPFVNAPWYYDRFIKTPENDSAIATLFASKPITVSIRCFELLVMMLKTVGKSLVQLCTSREELGYAVTGDWDAYLERIANEQSGIVELPYVQEDLDAFFREFGVGDFKPDPS